MSEIKMLKYVESKLTFIDAGANIGLVSKLVLARITNPNLRIIAYEPDIIAFNKLVLIEDYRFSARNSALLDYDGLAKLYRHFNFQSNLSTTSSTLNATKTNVNSENTCMVETLDIAKVSLNHGDNELVMKLDVEGSEYKVLNRLIRTGQIKKYAAIFCEFHPHKIRFGIIKHILLVFWLRLTRNSSRIQNWH